MKKAIVYCAMLAMVAVAMPAQATGNITGFIYEDSVTPGHGYSAGAAKTGKSVCTSFFAVVGLGDCSVKAAMKNGGIKSASYYEVQTKNILGYKKVTTIVSGQ